MNARCGHEHPGAAAGTKSRYHLSTDNCGEYMLVEEWRGLIVLGEYYDATLEDIAAFLGD